MPMLPTGLIRNPKSGVYYLRRRIPTDLLVSYSGRKEIIRSLRTSEYRFALEQHRREEAKLTTEWEHLRQKQANDDANQQVKAITYLNSLGPEEIEAICNHFEAVSLAGDEERRAEGTRSDVLSISTDFWVRHGLDAAALLEEAGISASALSNPNLYISWERYDYFIQLAVEQCKEPDFGLKHSLTLPPLFPTAGPLLLLAQFTPTLRNWIETGSQYARVHTNSWTPHLTIEQGNAVFQFLEHPLHMMSRHVAEGLMSTMFLLVREITHRHDLMPSLARFRHPRPDDTSLHQQIFGCALEFDAPHNEFVYDAAYLDLPLGGKLSMFRGLMNIYVKREMRRIIKQQGGLSTAVAAAIPAVLGTELCTAGSIANGLGMSEKKMQRLLRDEGTSFREITIDVRRDLAQKLLVKSDVPIEIIGSYLGYGSPAAFTQAFSNWAGEAPSVYRKTRRQEDPE